MIITHDKLTVSRTGLHLKIAPRIPIMLRINAQIPTNSPIPAPRTILLPRMVEISSLNTSRKI